MTNHLFNLQLIEFISESDICETLLVSHLFPDSIQIVSTLLLSFSSFIDFLLSVAHSQDFQVLPAKIFKG